MSAGVGDVVGETGQPLQGVHGLEVPAERGVHAGAVEDGLPPVEVDELLERERRSDEITRQVLDGLLVLEGDRLADVRGEARMRPGDELAREVLRDRVVLDEAGEQALTEQLHHRFRVPVLEGVKGAVGGESPIGQEKVSVGMPLDEVPGGGDGDDDTGPAVWAESCPDVLGGGLGGALGEVEEELPALPEDPPQEAGHGEDEVAMRNGREHLLLEPLRPKELTLLLA
jgi:hypothetical protein